MRTSLLSFAILSALIGCSSSSDAPRAEVSAATVPVAATPAAARTYRFDGTSSRVEFTGAKVTASHDGRFGAFTGTVQLPASGDVTQGSVAAEIEMASLSIEPERLNGHLRSPDLLDIAQFPKARFTSTSIRAGGANGATHTLTGNLELHGQTKSITFPATIRASGNGVEANAQFVINRKDFGIVYPGMPDDLIKDDVTIKLTIRAS